LKELFRRLRDEEEHLTPPFLAMWEAARARQKTSQPFRLSILQAGVAVGILIVVVGLSGVLVFRQQRTRLPVRAKAGYVSSITQWRSPTGSLLRPPGGQWLSTVPRFGGWHGDLTAWR